MNHLFANYELSLLAKEKGFDDPCLGYYDNPNNSVWITITLPYYANKKHVCLAPLYQQLLDWFREKHNFDVYCYKANGVYIGVLNDGDTINRYPNKDYYKALNETIEEAFKLI